MVWTIQSMAEHNLDNVIFASDDVDFLGAILRPRAWPSFIGEVIEISIALGAITR